MIKRLQGPLLAAGAVVLLAVLGVRFLQSQLPEIWRSFLLPESLKELLLKSKEDQRQLRALDPENEETYRQRHQEIDRELGRYYVLEANTERVWEVYEGLRLAFLLAAVLAVSAAYLVRQGHTEARLSRVRRALEGLVDGQTDLEVGERRRDAIGRIASMIEIASRVIARDRQRLKALNNLSAWQEAARRHAHEMRTPLTGARLELERLEEMLGPEKRDAEEGRLLHGALQELERLRRFTDELTSFARIPQPQPKAGDLRRLVEEFVETFAQAWPNLRLVFEPPEAPQEAETDRDLLRQVLVNLCDNSSLALGEADGRVTFQLTTLRRQIALEVSDDGPGIDPAIRERIFEPYTTTRGIGQGMGLGLALAKKMQLDLGGDLELRGTSPSGTTFRLLFPRPEAAVAAPDESRRMSYGFGTHR